MKTIKETKIENEMINLFGKTYKYKVYNIYGNDCSGNNEPIMYSVHTSKGKFNVEGITKQEIRDFKLKEMGL